MNKIKNYWAGFVGEISSAISEKDCKTFSVVYTVIAIFMALLGTKKSKWYLLGTVVYGILAGALYKSYKQQRRERWEKKFNEPVEK